jgi:choline dehydrogenase
VRRRGWARRGRPRGDPVGGAVGSPHILQLSGVGAPEHPGRVSIAAHHDLPGVGQNLQDHFIARVRYAVQGGATVNERPRGMALAAEVLRYLVTGKGMMTYSASLAAASVKGAGGIGDPDVQCSIAPGCFKDGGIGELDEMLQECTTDECDMRPAALRSTPANSR